MEELKNEIFEQTMEETVGQEEPYKSGSVQYIDSREVAEIVGKEHSKLLRDIRTYEKQLNESKIGLVDFFIESSYVDTKGEHRPCYLVTKKGCEFIAHKLTGVKGTKFTATYINRFHEMEDQLTGKSRISSEAQAIFTEFVQKQIQFNQQQELFNKRIMERLDGTDMETEQEPEQDPELKGLNPFAPERELFDRRLKALSEGMDIATELSDVDKRTNLHYLYMTLEEELGFSFDSYLAVYRSETGNKYACNLHVIAANDRIYKRATEKIHNFIERKRMFG